MIQAATDSLVTQSRWVSLIDRSLAARRALVARRARRYARAASESFRHKSLRRGYAPGSLGGIQPQHAKRLRMQLAALESAQTIEDMDIPGFRLHALKDVDRGRWSIWVTGNWHLTFEFRDGQAHVSDYGDCH